MEAKVKKRIIITASVITILGVVGVIYFKYGRKSKSDDLMPEDTDSEPTGSSSGSTTVGSTIYNSNGISNTTGLTYPSGRYSIYGFQKYCREVKKHRMQNGNLMVVDGIFGKESKLAWNMYAKSFINRLGLNSTQWNDGAYKK